MRVEIPLTVQRLGTEDNHNDRGPFASFSSDLIQISSLVAGRVLSVRQYPPPQRWAPRCRDSADKHTSPNQLFTRRPWRKPLESGTLWNVPTRRRKSQCIHLNRVVGCGRTLSTSFFPQAGEAFVSPGKLVREPYEFEYEFESSIRVKQIAR